MSVRYYKPKWPVFMSAAEDAPVVVISVTPRRTGNPIITGHAAHTGITSSMVAWWKQWGNGTSPTNVHPELTPQEAACVIGIPIGCVRKDADCITVGIHQGRAYAQLGGTMFYLISPPGEPAGITVTRLRKSLKANKIRVLRGTYG